jgi:hypothetical protein
MPNKRRQGQRLLTLPAKGEFVQSLDDNLAKCGYSNRSQFIRDAVIEKLHDEGIAVPKHLALAASRTEQCRPVSYKTKRTKGQK